MARWRLAQRLRVRSVTLGARLAARAGVGSSFSGPVRMDGELSPLDTNGVEPTVSAIASRARPQAHSRRTPATFNTRLRALEAGRVETLRERFSASRPVLVRARICSQYVACDVKGRLAFAPKHPNPPRVRVLFFYRCTPRRSRPAGAVLNSYAPPRCAVARVNAIVVRACGLCVSHGQRSHITP